MQMQLLLRNGHVSEESLGLQVIGDLSRQEAALVEQHVRGCHLCANKATEIAGFIRMLRLLALRMKCYGSSASRTLATSR